MDNGNAGKPLVTEEIMVPNSPPRFVSTPMLNFKAEEYVYEAKADDADSDALAYTLEKGPVGMVIDGRSGRLAWQVGQDQAGEHVIKVAVTDGHAGALSRNISSASPSSKGGGMDRSRTSGFTMIEVVVAIAVMAIMTTIALPNLLEWSRGAKYKAVARNLASAMRSARSQAIASNREHELLVDVSGDGNVTYAGKNWKMPINGYMLLQGNLANGSSDNSWHQLNLLPDITTGGSPLLSPNARIQLRLTSGTKCDGTTDVQYQFNPDGTSSSFYVCVNNPERSAARQLQWKIGIKSAVSGRIEITRK
jgi:prepilin-type N-terminal cleavage/methylation domain-containing protein